MVTRVFFKDHWGKILGPSRSYFGVTLGYIQGTWSKDTDPYSGVFQGSHSGLMHGASEQHLFLLQATRNTDAWALHTRHGTQTQTQTRTLPSHSAKATPSRPVCILPCCTHPALPVQPWNPTVGTLPAPNPGLLTASPGVPWTRPGPYPFSLPTAWAAGAALPRDPTREKIN